MKFTAILLLTACLTASARGYSQRITLSEKNSPLEMVFKKIEAQAGYSFLYQNEWMAQAKPVDIVVKDASLQEALDLCFKNQPFSYAIVDRVIIVKQKTESQLREVVASVKATIDVTGRVTDSAGAPLAGASVKVKGTKKGTTTNVKGEFTVEANAGDVLIVTFVGYKEKVIAIGNQSTLDITLEAANSVLDETVIQAYGTTSRRVTTSSIVKVTGQDIQKQPVSNFLQALEGRVPGMLVTQTSGVPGSAVHLDIRGRSSLGLGTDLPFSDPLFIIDGVPYLSNNNSLNQLTSAASGLSPFNLIDPNSIESIEVLKDADATAIYGSRGANGVILITTKKGRMGKTALNINVSSGASKVTRTADWMNTQQYLAMRHEAFANDGATPDIYNAPDLVAWDTARYTDFKKLLTGGTANTTDVSANLSGGTEFTRFLIGGSYHHETTVFPGNSSNERASGNFNLDHHSKDRRLSLALSSNYSLNNLHLPFFDLSQSLQLSPDAPPLYDSLGNLNWSAGGVDFYNPMSALLMKNQTQSSSFISNLTISYRLYKGLTARMSSGYTSTSVDETTVTPIAAQDPLYSPTGLSDFANSDFKGWILEPQLEFVQWLGKGKLDVLVGGTFQKNKTNSTALHASGYTSDDLLLSAAAAPSLTATTSQSNYNYMAGFARIGYNWKDKYLVNLSGRRDGSSRFGPGYQFGNFGAVGAGWVFSKEYFLNRSKVLSFGKLRGSYGTTGSDGIADYQYMDTWSNPGSPYYGIPVLTPSRLPNPNIHWQTNKKLEVAADLGFFNDKLLLTAAWYNNRTGDQLISYSEPLQTGFPNVAALNFPAVVQNTGWELSVQYSNHFGPDVSWSTAFNITIPKNKLVSFPDLASSTYGKKLIIGQPINLIRVFRFAGLNDTTGLYQFYDSKGNITTSPDFNKDVVPLSLDPKFFGGWDNTISWKGFSLNFFFEFRKQDGKTALADLYANAPGFMYNLPAELLNRWQKPGDKAQYQLFTTGNGSPDPVNTALYYSVSNAAFTDASFIRLKTLGLSYNFSEKMKHSLHLGDAIVYLRGQNLVTITKYKWADPETQSILFLPPLKTIVAGIQLSF